MTASAAQTMRVKNATKNTVLAENAAVANTSATRRRGLLERGDFPRGEGLWIVPCEAVHTFWMKFPIDLVYLNKRKQVVKVRHAVPPWRVSACLRAHSVLELPPGTARETETEPGDQLEFERS